MFSKPDQDVSHRPWPLPDSPWAMRMRWHRLLFAHWPVRPGKLRPLVPEELEIDLFDGWAWIGVVPFEMSDVRLRLMPGWLALSFPELNVRTYVKSPGRAGVWFLSLDATSRLAVRTARLWYRLPYFDADMTVSAESDVVHYRSSRTHRGAAPAALDCSYRPTGAGFSSALGSFEQWATERYALYSGRSGTLGFGDIHHEVWPLQPAEAEFRLNTMVEPLGISLPPEKPRLHYADELDVRAWTIKRMDR